LWIRPVLCQILSRVRPIRQHLWTRGEARAERRRSEDGSVRQIKDGTGVGVQWLALAGS